MAIELRKKFEMGPSALALILGIALSAICWIMWLPVAMAGLTPHLWISEHLPLVVDMIVSWYVFYAPVTMLIALSHLVAPIEAYVGASVRKKLLYLASAWLPPLVYILVNFV
jgi:hypothetical protein